MAQASALKLIDNFPVVMDFVKTTAVWIPGIDSSCPISHSIISGVEFQERL